MKAVGVDGWRRGWVAVELEDGEFADARFFARLQNVVEAFPDAAAIGVDIPIGLPPPWPRCADLAAKAFIPEQAAAVFLTFPRPIYEAPTHAEATAAALSLVGRGISQQSYRLGPRILEADVEASDARLVEVHPEISFRALSGKPLPSKKTWGGQIRRRRTLAAHGVKLPDDLPEADGVPPDDVIDAAAAAWSAHRKALGKAKSLPDPPERIGDRLVAIWY